VSSYYLLYHRNINFNFVRQSTVYLVNWYMGHVCLPDYHCGYSEAWSSLYTFTAMPTTSDWSPRFAIFGDMGNVNAKSVGRLQEETQAGNFDAMLHVGQCTCCCRVIVILTSVNNGLFLVVQIDCLFLYPNKHTMSTCYHASL